MRHARGGRADHRVGAGGASDSERDAEDHGLAQGPVVLVTSEDDRNDVNLSVRVILKAVQK
jgi:hypothetical protein